MPSDNFFAAEKQSDFVDSVYKLLPQELKADFEQEIALLRDDLATARRPLEVGCGTGRILQNLDLRNCTALDIGFSNVKTARKLCPRYHFVCADAGKLPFPDSTFDSVFLVQNTLGNIPEIEMRVIAEAKRVTRGSGKVILSVYTEKSYPMRYIWYERLVKNEIFGNVWLDPQNPRIARSDTGWSSRCFDKDEIRRLCFPFKSLNIREIGSLLYFCILHH